MDTVEELHRAHPKVLKDLFKRISLEKIPHESLKVSLEKKEFVEAGKKLLQFFHQFDLEERLRFQAPELVQKIDMEVNDILQNKFQFPSGKIDHPLKENNALKWHYLGPNEDIEYGYRINRFSWIPVLKKEYYKTKEKRRKEEIAEYINRNIQDWILSNPRPYFKKKNESWRV